MLMKGVSIEIMMRTMGRVAIIMMILMIKMNMLLEMTTVAMMSTKMLLHGDDIRMTMMLMNMIMATAKTQPFSQCTPIYSSIGAAAGP